MQSLAFGGRIANIDAMDQALAPRPSTMSACALELLLGRQSADVLEEPAPDGLNDLILDAGLRAPVMGRPWRFVLIRGERTHEWAERVGGRLGRAAGDGAAIGERYRAWVGRTPLIIAVGIRWWPGTRSRCEQVQSAGAAAMNMLNAIHMLGYGGMWVTGLNAYDPRINALLGFGARAGSSASSPSAPIASVARRASVACRTHDGVERLTPTLAPAGSRRAARRRC